MITLNLRELHPNAQSELPPEPILSLTEIERQLASLMNNLSRFLAEARRATVVIPSDLLLQASTTMFPAERMAVIAGRPTTAGTLLGASYDVTGVGPETHRAHVRADPRKLQQALIGFERAGVELAAWLHSHPGTGPMATCPSGIDRAQYRGWTRDFGPALVGFIIVSDGHVRLWGDSIESGKIHPEIVGDGVRAVLGHRHVYQLAR